MGVAKLNTLDYSIKQKTENKIITIDILRGFAILAVILVHTAQQIEGDMFLRSIAKYGQMGVQLFFVVSAFTLCYSFESRKKEGNKIFNFYIRRFFRIAPVYYFGIILYFILSIILGNVWNKSNDFLDIIVNIFFLNGLVPSSNNNVVPGGWSIGTEILFYAIFPLIYHLFVKAQDKFKNFYLVFPFLVSILSLTIQVVFYNINKNPEYFSSNTFIYYSILNQLPVFCVGISFFYYFMNKAVDRWISKFNCSIMFIIFTMISGLVLYKGSNVSIFYINIFPLASAISFVYLFMLIHQMNLVKPNVFSKIGVLSFSSYIIHFSFTFYLIKFLSKNVLDIFPVDIQLVILYFVTVLLTYIIAKIIYKTIEINGLKVGKKIINIREENQISSKMNHSSSSKQAK